MEEMERKIGYPDNVFEKMRLRKRWSSLTNTVALVIVVLSEERLERSDQNVIEQEKMLEILKKGLLFRNMDDDEIMEALETMGSHRMSIPSAP